MREKYAGIFMGKFKGVRELILGQKMTETCQMAIFKMLLMSMIL